MVWWINTMVWWINTRFWWINTQGLVDQHLVFVDQHQGLVDQQQVLVDQHQVSWINTKTGVLMAEIPMRMPRTQWFSGRIRNAASGAMR